MILKNISITCGVSSSSWRDFLHFDICCSNISVSIHQMVHDIFCRWNHISCEDVMKCKHVIFICRFENHCFEGHVHIGMVVVYVIGFSVSVLELQVWLCTLLWWKCSCYSWFHRRIVGRRAWARFLCRAFLARQPWCSCDYLQPEKF